MTGRERILAALTGKQPDRVPWVPRISTYSVAWQPGGDNRESSRWSIPAYLREVGADIIYYFAPAVVKTRFDSVKVKEKRDGRLLRRTYETPLGSLTEIDEDAPGRETTWKVEFLVKQRSDYRILRYILEDRVYEPSYTGFDRATEAVGQDGITVTGGALSSFSDLAVHYRGLEAFVYDMADMGGEMADLLDLADRKGLEAVRIAADSPADAVAGGGAFTEGLTLPQYRDYILPYLQEQAVILKAKGKLLLFHHCGHIKRLLPYIAQTGGTAVESLAEPPLGDTTVAEALEVLTPAGMAVIGGLSPVQLVFGTPEQVREDVWRLLASAKGYPNYILGTGDPVPPDAPKENLLVARNAVAEFFGDQTVPGGHEVNHVREE